MKGQVVGYARVSTAEQNEARQIEALTAAGAENIFLDKVSGKNTDRPQLQNMLKYIRQGDVVIISEYARLARNAADLLNLIKEIEGKGASCKSIKENLDTSTPTGKLMITLLAGIAEFERDMILQRQKEGIAIAKAEGKYKGRKASEKPQEWEAWRAAYQGREITATELAKRCGVSRPIIYKWLKEQ